MQIESDDNGHRQAREPERINNLSSGRKPRSYRSVLRTGNLGPIGRVWIAMAAAFALLVSVVAVGPAAADPPPGFQGTVSSGYNPDSTPEDDDVRDTEAGGTPLSLPIFTFEDDVDICGTNGFDGYCGGGGYDANQVQALWLASYCRGESHVAYWGSFLGNGAGTYWTLVFDGTDANGFQHYRARSWNAELFHFLGYAAGQWDVSVKCPSPAPVPQEPPGPLRTSLTCSQLRTDGPSHVTVDNVTYLYFAFFGRTPDTQGCNYWYGLITSGQANVGGSTGPADGPKECDNNDPFCVVSYWMLRSGEWSNYLDTTDQQFIDRLYVELLERAADSGGLSYWKDLLRGTNDSGSNSSRSKYSRAEVSVAFAFSREFKRAIFDDGDTYSIPRELKAFREAPAPPPPSPVGFACSYQVSGGNVTVSHTGSDVQGVNDYALKGQGNRWLGKFGNSSTKTVTTSSAGDLAQLYIVALVPNSGSAADRTEPCTNGSVAPPPPSPVGFACSYQVSGGNVTVSHTGSDVQGVNDYALKGQGNRWLGKFENSSTKTVTTSSAGDLAQLYIVALVPNSGSAADRTEPCTNGSVAPPPPSPVGFACSYQVSGGNVTVSHTGSDVQGVNDYALKGQGNRWLGKFGNSSTKTVTTSSAGDLAQLYIVALVPNSGSAADRTEPCTNG